MQETLRKVQLIGRSTFVVSLPKSWAIRMGLKPGIPLRIILEPDGSLRVTPPGLSESRVTESRLVVSEKMSEGALTRELMSRYLAGYSVIRLAFKDATHRLRKTIQSAIANKMIGVEIVEDNEGGMTLQVLVNVNDLPVTTVVQRMSQIARGMIADSIEGLLQKNPELLLDVKMRDDLVDKLYLYLLRQLNACIRGFVRPRQVGLSFVEESIQYAVVGKSIERVGDHAEKIASNALSMLERERGLSPEVAERLRSMAETSLKIFEDATTCFTGRDRKRALELMDEYPPVIIKAENNLVKSISVDGGDTYSLSLRLISDSLRRIHDYSMDILEATIDLSLEKTCKDHE